MYRYNISRQQLSKGFANFSFQADCFHFGPIGSSVDLKPSQPTRVFPVRKRPLCWARNPRRLSLLPREVAAHTMIDCAIIKTMYCFD